MNTYYSSADVQRANCRSYFSSLGAADFSVASSVLKKDALLFSEARSCLVSATDEVYHKHRLRGTEGDAFKK